MIMSEEIITTLSNLGALEETKAIGVDVLKHSQQLKDKVFDDEVRKLIQTGYVRETDGKVYLTKAGLFRALSRFS